MTTATVPGSVDPIGRNAFDGCSALNTVYFTGDQFNNDWYSSFVPNRCRFYFAKAIVAGSSVSELFMYCKNYTTPELIAIAEEDESGYQSILIGFSQHEINLVDDPSDLTIVCYGDPQNLRYSVKGDSVKLKDNGLQGITLTPVREGKATVYVSDGKGPKDSCTVEVHPTQDLSSLQNGGSVSVALSCSSIQRGTIRITNNTDHSVHFTVRPGTYMLSSGGSCQNMLIMTKVSGSLYAGESRSFDVDTCCMNIHRSIPTSSNKFSLSVSDSSKLRALAKYCQNNDVSYSVRQAATWILTDSASYSDCTILRSQYGNVISEDDYQKAKELLNSLS